uniref:A kinase-anchoring proteins AKAP-5 and AKAP-12 calmodulin (CaM)-binding domain-containing protein n=1 Tax=Lates calcarifer TaxID=8187 RepID=A0A4W6EY24_LATCA
SSVLIFNIFSGLAILSPGEDVSETAKPLEEETPLENVEINEKESPDEVDTNEEVMTEMDAKQNDINESFRRFFSNIGLKLTVKRGSPEKAEIPTDVPDETNKEESNQAEDIEDMAKETNSDNAEQNIDLNAVQETYDNDSTTCPTLTDVTSEDVRENAEEKTTEVESDNVDTATPVDEHEKAQQDATVEEDVHPASPSSPEAEVVSPIKKFFTTGIFSGLRKKKKPTENETTEKELVDMGKKETVETTEQQDKEKEENELKEEILSADDGKSPPRDPTTITVNEPEITSSQEKVQASPLKRLLSGSSLKKHSKKQRGRKSSDAKLSDSGEHFSDQLMSSTESAENQKEESPAQPTVEPAGEEDGAWASFKKLVTPKKRMKKPSTNEETQIPASVEETKPSEGEQLSDQSTEEDKKRKDSSVSWEAVLCGSGRRRSRGRKTSDSEDETPQAENDNKKQESPLEGSNEVDEILASSPKQAGSPSEGDGGSTWKSLKKLVTPKRKAKDEEESKDNIQSDSEATQDDPSFSIKKLLPGRKKRKSAEKQDQVSSDEADKDVVSGDEDSETPAVVPLSEFDTVETGVHVKTQAPTAPVSNEEPEDLTDLISKHQQLSDIPEEGVITETMATPASVTEEAARDDTIAEDLIEITSEAITAPEPVDITLADETEMISAVSQLSESSKTSGNTTPVPVEYDVKDTEAVLYQVVETISISPKAIPVCSDEVSSERIAGSVSHQILETFEKEEPTILEMHRRSDVTVINTGLNVEEMDIINKLAATVQTESITEVKEAISTEIVSKVPTEEFDTAKTDVDEVHEVSEVQTLTEKEDQVLQNITDQVQVEDKDQPPVEVEKLQELPAVQAVTLDSEDTAETVIDKAKEETEEESSVQVREKTEVTPAPCVDDAAVIDEPTHELQLSAVQANVEVEKESELPGAETKSAAVEHAIVAEVTTCYLKDVSAAIPDVLIEKTSDVHEPLIDSVANEQDFKRTIETATALVKDDVTETAEEGSAVMMINVPSVQFENNHRIQVQVVDVEIRSAEPIVDTVLEVGVTETKEVIDVCHETVKVVDMLSATSETEENLIHEENKVTIQEVIHHVKETLPETVPESEVDNLEQEVIKQPAAVTEASEIAEVSVVEDQKVMEDSTGTSMERQDEAHAIISDDSVTEQQVFKDLTQAPDIPGGEDALIHDHKEDLEEPKVELEKAEADVTTEEVKLPSGELAVKKINEEAEISQIAQSQIVTPSNTGLVVPQNTGIISSIGNVESPSSLSLEFKLNIQFGQAKAPASPPPTTERIEPVKKTDMSEVGIQAVEPKEKTNPTQSAESQKQAELTEVAVQATEITEPEPAKPDSTETAVIMNQPVLLDVDMQAVETVEPVEQIKSTEKVTPNVQATETVQTVRQTEKREVFLSQPVLSEACDPETKAEEPVRQTEEENEQDVWMDAEEDIYAQDETGVSLPEVQEPLEHQAESEQEEKAVFEQETEIAPNAKPEEEGGQQEMIKTEGTCEIESEGEDFAVALEHPETATASVTTMEWD